MSLLIDKLPTARADLVRMDKDWQERTFLQLVDALKKRTIRNPKINPSPEKGFKRGNSYQTNE